MEASQFFQDSEGLSALEAPLTELLAAKPDGAPVRIWVPACSTGEEAYSVAMLAHEIVERLGRALDVRVFASDVDPRACSRTSPSSTSACAT